MPSTIEILKGIVTDLENLKFDDSTELDRLRRRTEMVIRNALGNDSSYLDDLSKIGFSPSIWISGMDTKPSWERGQGAFINLVDTIIEEIQLFAGTNEEVSPAIVSVGVKAIMRGRVFVVHGRDEEMKTAVASTLTKIGLDPRILHE